MDIFEAVKQGKIIKDSFKSPEFKNAIQDIKDWNSETPTEKKVQDVKDLLPFLLPVGDFAIAFLNKEGDEMVNEIKEVLTLIHND